nr:FAD-binding protein [Bacteroidota bacterium]
MPIKLSLSLPPEVAIDDARFRATVIKAAAAGQSAEIRLLKRSIDARKKDILIHIEVEVFENETAPPLLYAYAPALPDVTKAKSAIIVGCGPAGMFAAHRLIEQGIRPILLERGKDVQARRRDLAAINREHIVDPDSNYCFGEGGAGTYSDGKLYTRSTKRGNVRRILEILVAHGAPENILADTHPHIGTNKLPKVVAALRETIIRHGGEVHFNARVTDFILKTNEIAGVCTADGKEHVGIGVILATGHSARDIFELCERKDVLVEAKPFAMGVRVEHPQELIDKIQYHGHTRDEWLPAASYALVNQQGYKGETRGVFSFCMCPGGFIVASATAPGEVVVNGMSPSRRDSRFANSGMVVSILEEDIKNHAAHGTMAGLRMQQQLEQNACKWAGGTQTAPAQRLLDFVEGRASVSLPETSYIPGLASVPLHELLPAQLAQRLRGAFR